MENDKKIQIVSPPHERVEKLKNSWKPSNEAEFYEAIEQPWDKLKNWGFKKWDTMNSIIQENIELEPDIIDIPIINGEEDEVFSMKVGSLTRPRKLLNKDEDVILFPGEWFDIIPNGFEATSLWGETVIFNPEKADDDIRFGCIPYGIRRVIE